MTPEKTFISTLLNNWTGIHVCRIENTAMNGMPDINFVHKNFDAWIEAKICKGNWVYYNKFQVAFHVNRNHRVGNCFTLAKITDRKIGIFRLKKEDIRYGYVVANRFVKYDIRHLNMDFVYNGSALDYELKYKMLELVNGVFKKNYEQAFLK